MTMPASGALNLAGTSSPVSVAQELGLGLTTTISMNDAAVRTLAGVGGSGTSWSMNSLYGKSNRVTSNITISANTQNYVLNTAKVTGYSAGKTDVTLTINSGVYVGSSTTGGIGLDVDTSWAAGDTVTIINNGFIVGCGGAGGGGGYADYNVGAGNGSNGGGGGAALRAQRAVSMSNNNTIAGGGGGGGGGGGKFVGAKCHYYVYGGGGGGGGQGSSGGGGAAGGTASNSPYGENFSGQAGGSGTTGGAGGGGYGGRGVQAAGLTDGQGGSGGSWGAAGATANALTNGLPGSGGGGGNCTTSGSNANITWNATGTRYGTIG